MSLKPIRSITRVNKQYGGVISNIMNNINETSAKAVQIYKYLLMGPSVDQVAEGLDLSGKTCVITGGNCGIGYEIVRTLLGLNCDVIMACRNLYSARTLSQYSNTGKESLKVYETHLGCSKSVQEFCAQVIQNEKKIDIVILNAAVLGVPWSLTKDGLETTFQVNYLSQYYMLMELAPILANDARIVWMSSEDHRNVKWSTSETSRPTPELLSMPQENYNPVKAYNVSKLCGLLAMNYLSYHWASSRKSIFCACPGKYVKTNLGRNSKVYDTPYMQPFSKPIRHATATPVFCATSPDLVGRTGIYFKDSIAADESVLAKDYYLAARINEISRTMIENHFVSPRKEQAI